MSEEEMALLNRIEEKLDRILELLELEEMREPDRISTAFQGMHERRRARG